MGEFGSATGAAVCFNPRFLRGGAGFQIEGFSDGGKEIELVFEDEDVSFFDLFAGDSAFVLGCV